MNFHADRPIEHCQVCKKGVLQTGEYKNPPKAIVTHEDTLNTYPPKVPRACRRIHSLRQQTQSPCSGESSPQSAWKNPAPVLPWNARPGLLG